MSVAKQWEFDEMEEEQYRKVFELVKENKEGFVLKPNCEGGGNNFFKEEVFNVLNMCNPEERQKYILMERIQTPSYQNCLINGSSSEMVNCDYEVSHYGVINGKDKEL